jgi:hypothetical protein
LDLVSYLYPRTRLGTHINKPKTQKIIDKIKPLKVIDQLISVCNIGATNVEAKKT